MVVEQPRTVREVAEALNLPKTTIRDMFRTFWVERLVHIHEVRLDARKVRQVVVYGWGPEVDNVPPEYENRMYGRLNKADRAALEDNTRRKASERAFLRLAAREASAPRRKPTIKKMPRT